MVKALEERDQVIQTLAMLGFNPFQNDDKELRHVLSCYNNCGKRDLVERVKLLTHMYLIIDNPLLERRKDINRVGDSNPRFIIYDDIMLRANPATGIYQASVGLISVLDGYVPIDPKFDV